MCRMPIGIDDFRMLREEDYYFVDKTHFIKSLIDYHAQVTLITRPRRFGKTLMLSMLQEFFDINAAGGNLFDGLKIVQAGDFYTKKQGKYPVIFISLKDMGVGNFKKTMCMLRAMLSDLYKQFSFLLEADVLSEDEKGYFEKIKQADEYMVAEFAMSLSRLSEYLCRYYGVKPIVLIDEYDAPVQYAWEHGFYDEMIVCMRPFYSKLLKSNKNLEFAVLTGVLRVAKESIFSGLNNLHVCSVLENDYGDVFGFTPDEVQGIAAQLDREDKLPELKEWYDGYLFGGKEIYNPWSVIKYFQNDCKLGAYWVNTSENGIIKYLLQDLDGGSRAELQHLLEGGSVAKPLQEGVVYTDIGRNRDDLYTMLLTTGYLKAMGEEIDMFGRVVEMAIPNKEIYTLFAREVMQYMNGYRGTSELRNMLQAMLTGNAEVFEAELSRLLRNLVSYHDTANGESFYHGLMLGMCVLLRDRYIVKSNWESGYGRFDLALVPRNKNVCGVLLEFKKADNKADLPAKAEAAAEQIESREYAVMFSEQDIDKVWKYGVAFCGKHVCLRRY